MRNFFYVSFCLILLACNYKKQTKQKVEIAGFAQGTTYNIVYINEDGKNYQRAIDSTLIAIDNSLSTYNKKSLITKWNQSDDGNDVILDELFIDVHLASKEVYEKTNGAFDPTVAPLVNLWGFGFENKDVINANIIDSTLKFIGYHQLDFLQNEKKLIKTQPKIMLDYNAVAQGYSVDVLGKILEKRGIVNYLIEVGGEMKAKGVNMQDTLWRIGVDKPLPNLATRELQAIVHLNNKSLATSGNYHKFYIKDGKKYAHTINPKTGYPIEHNLLSATVIADKCAIADAYATAFMVIGLEESKKILSENNNLDALLIYSTEKGNLETFVTEYFKQFIQVK